MNKYALRLLAILLSGSVLFGCAQISNNNSNSKSGVAMNGERADVQAEYIILAEHTASNITVSGIEQKSMEIIAPITVQINNQSKTYQWESVSNPTYYPELIVDDLDMDGNDELYLFLTKGYGTGVLNTEAHIMGLDFSEIATPNPNKDLKSRLTSSVVEKDEQQMYTINFNSSSYHFAFPLDAAAMWFEEASVGKITTYHIINKRLVVSQSLQVSPNIFIGTIETSYRLEKGQFVLDDSVFIKDEPQEEADSKENTAQ